MPRKFDELTRRGFLTAATAACSLGLLGAQGEHTGTDRVGLEPWTGKPETAARFTVRDASALSLLQITDLHFFCQLHKPEQDKRTIEALARYVELVEPDLVLMTGDLWHNNPEGRGAEYMQFAVPELEKLGVPWLFVWGNHDLLDAYGPAHELFTNAKHSLYRGGPTGGNYLVQACDAGGKAVWDFVCLNSSDIGLQPAQRAYVKTLLDSKATQPLAPHAFGIFHIPLRQYLTIWEEKHAAGVKFESVAYEQEDGTSLDALLGLGTLRGCFCGHDHINDFSGTAAGVPLIYGRATGYGGYGENRLPKGAKRIRVNAESGAFEWVTLFPDGSTWKEEAGIQMDNWRNAPWNQRRGKSRAK